MRLSAPHRLDLSAYAQPSTTTSLVQLVTTFIPLVALWWVMAATAHVSWWLTLALAVPATALRLRMMLFQHDCGHGSFFKSRQANDVLGAVLSVPSWAPYHYWRRTHALHHVNSSRIEGRDELGSIMTLTVTEYEALSPGQRLWYRVYRNPLFLCGIGGPLQFLVKHRFPWDTPRTWKWEWASVLYTNVGLALSLAALSHFWGLETVLKVELPVIGMASFVAVWLIYIQHVFDGGFFAKGDAWNLEEASTRGSSYYQLPALLNWATLNVGYHHVHHYSQRIPNYRLADCMKAYAELRDVPPLTFTASLGTWKLKLWDEEREAFVGFPPAESTFAARSS